MDERFTESRELIDYGFNNFEKQKLKVDKNNTISVVKGEEDTVTATPEKEILLITKKASKLLAFLLCLSLYINPTFKTDITPILLSGSEHLTIHRNVQTLFLTRAK